MSAFDPKRTFVSCAGGLTGITGCHLPRTRIHHHAGRTFISCELDAKGCGDFIVPLFGQFAGFTVHLTSRSDCKLKLDGIVQIFAYEYLSINLLKLDVLVPGDFKLFCHNSSVSHRERSGTACLRILPRWRQIAQHDILSRAQPRVILDAAPDNHCHDAAGLEAFTHVAHSRYGVFEELRAKPREAKIMNGFERVRLHVLRYKGDVSNARCLGTLAPAFEKRVTAINGQDRSGGTH